MSKMSALEFMKVAAGAKDKEEKGEGKKKVLKRVAAGTALLGAAALGRKAYTGGALSKAKAGFAAGGTKSEKAKGAAKGLLEGIRSGHVFKAPKAQ